MADVVFSSLPRGRCLGSLNSFESGREFTLKLVGKTPGVMWHKLATGSQTLCASTTDSKVAQIRRQSLMKGSRRKKPALGRANPPVGMPTSSHLSRGKLWCFRLLMAIGVPVLILGFLELALRLAGFGYPTGFLLASQRDGRDVLVQNNQFGWRFFGAAMARTPAPICIPRAKGSNTVRIIVFGESAAFGDPDPRFGLPRLLQAMLELRYPGTHFEVVNAGMTAINSNVILPIARDCTAADADIWVIYMGNNEVVGPFGAGTVFGQQTPPLSLIRANLALKATRTGQLIDGLLRKLHQPPAGKSEWGGMEMFLDQQVQADDPRMNIVYDHFARNLSDIISAGKHSGAGIVVSTVAVNLKDSAPFASAHRRGLNEEDKTKWEGFYQSGIAAQTAGNFNAAAGAYHDAAQIDGDFAELQFRAGRCALSLSENDGAQKAFAAARDQDTLRFRCDTQLNGLIRQTVSKQNDQRVVLADAERDFAAESPNGLPGSDLFYEHVHLTFEGNYLLARSIAPKVESLLPGKIAGSVAASQAWPSEADCARRLAWSDWDRQKSLSEMLSRLNNPPFSGQISHDEQVQKIKTSLSQLIPATRPAGVLAAETLCQNAIAGAPDDPLLHAQLAELDELSGNLTGAETNAQRTVELLPNSSEDWSELGLILAKQGKYDNAVTVFRRAFELNSQDVWALQSLAQSLNDLGHPEEAIREYRHALAVKPRFGLAWMGLGQIYEKMGRKTEAEDCYHKALENRINRAPELTTLARLCETHGWYEAAATNYDDAIKLNPLDATLYVEAGQNYSAAGRNGDAAARYAEAIQLAPDSLQAHFLYGMELGKAGKPGDAAVQFREAVRIMPNLPEARLNLGMALENAGNYSEALDQFNKVLELSPTNAMALDHTRALREKVAASRGH